jgi:hypothetical protein
MTITAQPLRPVRTVAVATLLAVLVLLIGGQRAARATPAAPKPVKYYVVAPSFRGQPEFLFEIAQRFLGSGDRALEIFNLNKGRLEPGGLVVERPEVIRPGWVLRLPADAKGKGVHTGPLPRVPALPGGAASSAPGSGSAPGSAQSPPSQAPAASSPNAAGPGGSGLALALWVLLGAAVLALAAAAVWARRTGRLALPNLNRLRRKRTAAPVHPDSSASWTVDRSLRALATACAQQHRPLPGVYAVVVGGEQIRLRLSAPDELPPAGWSVEQEGRTWVAALRGLQYAPVDDGRPDPYARLVTMGTTSDGRILLNLAEARGMIALDGDAAMQRMLAEEWTRELAANPWSRAVAVLRVGFGPAEGGTQPTGTRWVPEAGQLWDGLTEDAGGVVLLARAPGGRDLERLNEMASRAGREWTVVVLGGSKQARWQFAVRTDGWLETGFLPEPVRTGLEAGQLRPVAV